MDAVRSIVQIKEDSSTVQIRDTSEHYKQSRNRIRTIS
jgi:hypothetical protein